jgi:predicted site-specific integrase-resolvase
VVAYRDRLARFGVELITQIIESSGGKVVVLKQIDLSSEQELTSDIFSVFSYRMHGLRNYKSKVDKTLNNSRSKEDI